MRSGPKFASVYVAQVAESAHIVDSSVLPPPRNREVLPATVTTARVGHHDVIATIR